MSDAKLFERLKSDLMYDNEALTEACVKSSIIYVKSKETEIDAPKTIETQITENVTIPKNINKEAEEESSSDSIEVLNLEECPAFPKVQTRELKTDSSYNETSKKQEWKKMKDKTEIVRKKSINVFDEQYSFWDLIENPQSDINLIDPRKDLLKFLFTPPPKNVVVKCQLNKTNKNDKTMLFTKFIFSLQISDRDDNKGRKLYNLMAARPRKKSKTLNYIISTDVSELKVDSAALIGKMKGNFMGTKFLMYSKSRPNSSKTSNGSVIDASDSESDQGSDHSQSVNSQFKILGIIFYKNASFVAKKPREISAAIPRWIETEEVYAPNLRLPTDKNELSDFPEMCVFTNIEPTFNKKMKCYTLDFGGRAETISVKNFALKTNVDEKEKRVYQIGKCKDHYVIDYTYPLCAFQAFLIALSSCHRKFASD